MARCQGLQCDEIHIPYVDTYLRKSSSATEVTKLLNFEDPKVPINPEGHCKPQEFNGVCNVFNCPWVEFNTEETNSHQVSFFIGCSRTGSVTEGPTPSLDSLKRYLMHLKCLF